MTEYYEFTDTTYDKDSMKEYSEKGWEVITILPAPYFGQNGINKYRVFWKRKRV